MPRYTLRGVEVPVNPLNATTPPNLALTATIVANKDATAFLDKDALKRAKEEANKAAGGEGGNSKLFLVGGGVAALLYFLVLKKKTGTKAST